MVVLAVLEQDGPLSAIRSERPQTNARERRTATSKCQHAHLALPMCTCPAMPSVGKEGAGCWVSVWRSYVEVRSPLRYLRTTDLQSAIYRSLARPGALTAEGVYGYEGMWCQDEEAESICTFVRYSRCASLARDLDLLVCASSRPSLFRKGADLEEFSGLPSFGRFGVEIESSQCACTHC